MAKPATNPTPKNTKEKLITTATDLIWRDSYNAVSVDEICKQAGVQKGSFYHFFPSKADLALASMEWCIQEAILQYDEIFSIRHAPLERLTLLADHIYEKQQEKLQELGHVCGCPLMSLGSELAGKDSGIAERINDICQLKLAYYESVLKDLIRDDLIDKDTNIKIKAEEIFALIVGQLLLARIKNDLGFIKNDLKRAMIDLIGLTQKEGQKDKKSLTV